MSGQPKYPESLLHWVWKTSHINLEQLQTTTGLPLTIRSPGTHNPSDGPDFLNAELSIGSLKWYGDVEIHWTERAWNHHGHNDDPNYNRVILHIVYDTATNPGRPALRQDQTEIPTLHLKPYLNAPLQSFLEQYSRPDVLPCAGHLPSMPTEVFREQLKEAKRQYFEEKVNDLLRFYDPSLLPSRSWLNMLATAVFDNLGITHNRAPMRKLCRVLLSQGKVSKEMSRTDFIERAIGMAQLNASAGTPFGWKHKNSRPANHPRQRIRQAAEYLWLMDRTSFEQWLKKDIFQLWKQLNEQLQTRPRPGRERRGIIYGTVWLPSFFILGNLFGSDRLRSDAFSRWMNHQTKLPESLLSAFSGLDIPTEAYSMNLGAVYQIRAYCRPRKCEGCKVFKNVIYS